MAIYPEEYRYKIGDKVRVRADLHKATTYDTAYKMRSGPKAGGWASCRDKHLIFAGKIVTIKGYKLGGYSITNDPNESIFTDDMFDRLADDMGFRSLL